MKVQLLGLLGLLLSCSGCSFALPFHYDVGELEHRTIEIDASDVDIATLDLAFGAGELTLDSQDEGPMLSGTAEFNVAEFAPSISSSRQGNDGSYGLIMNPEFLGLNFWDWQELVNEWDLRLGKDVPLNLELLFAAGSIQTELGGVPLRQLRIELAACEARVEFNEPNPEFCEHFEISVGMAEAKFRGLGNVNFEKLTVEGVAEDLLLDFHGEWFRPATVRVDGGLGDITLVVPREISVVVDDQSGIFSDFDAPGFHQRGDRYSSDGHWDEPTLRIELDHVFGGVRLRRE